MFNFKHFYNDPIKDDRDFYTSLLDIEREVNHYKAHFEGKSVLCCCNDVYSAFGEFFMARFEELGLERLMLVSHSDDEEKPDMVVDIPKSGIALMYPLSQPATVVDMLGQGIAMADSERSFDQHDWTCLLRQADIVVTNPPAKMTGEMISTLFNSNKKFLIIANINAALYMDVIPRIVEGNVWLGTTVPRHFHIGAKGYANDEPTVMVGNMAWFTNLESDVERRHFNLTRKASDPDEPFEYDLIDGTEILWVNKAKDIPMDWKGMMAVPVSFLQRLNSDQFEILGEVNHGQDCEYDFAVPKVHGEKMYKHLVIRNKRVVQ